MIKPATCASGPLRMLDDRRDLERGPVTGECITIHGDNLTEKNERKGVYHRW